ncbi:VanZ family protein [Actinophytocola xanthii]|uniref:VanZ-like domain-containing protein n=1 Tax=Actinophytocola xanthii TaxID=1912961 RepID=A0A1Q8CPD3_9PSEU|nr:VanZ family protein [Actinophytocola xanthii]OLF16206.1 hypothetical protein BU204_17685 [Actinophytocola xanthii]
MLEILETLLAAGESVLRVPLVAAGVLLGSVSLAVAGLAAARRWGWRPVPAALAGVGLGVVLGVTLSRRRSYFASPEGFDEPVCLLTGFSVAGGSEVLNVLLFVPPVFFAVLATRRPAPVLGAAVVLSALIELAQTVTGRGVCETQDVLNNAVGALVAAVAGAGIVALGPSPVPVHHRTPPR